MIFDTESFVTQDDSRFKFRFTGIGQEKWMKMESWGREREGGRKDEDLYGREMDHTSLNFCQHFPLQKKELFVPLMLPILWSSILCHRLQIIHPSSITGYKSWVIVMLMKTTCIPLLIQSLLIQSLLILMVVPTCFSSSCRPCRPLFPI